MTSPGTKQRIVLRDIIDSPPQPGLDPFVSVTNTSSSGSGGTDLQQQQQQANYSQKTVSSNGLSHRPGQPVPQPHHPNMSDLMISPSTATTSSNSPTSRRQQQQQQQQQQKRKTSPPPHRHAAAAAAAAAAASSSSAAAKKENLSSNLQLLDSDIVSSINTSHGDYHFPQEFRSALSKTLFKLEAAEKIIAQQQQTIETERKIFQQRLESTQGDAAKRLESLEAESRADRTFLVQAKHDRDRWDRQYHDLLELAERREQEQQLEGTRWDAEKVALRKRAEEAAASGKSMSELLTAAQARIRALEEQLADRDARLQQLQSECAATRTETANFEKKIREGLLVDARISQKWLSEADAAKRDNQALCASLVRAMNLLARTVEYSGLIGRGAMGEGFVYTGADPNLHFGSGNVAAANTSAGVLESLVRDTNSLVRTSSVNHNPPGYVPAGAFPSVFDPSAGGGGGAAKPTMLRVERLRCESDYWVPKPAWDLLSRLLGWMEHACALKITPQVEAQLLPALQEWFVVLNAVWRERADEKVRASVQQQARKAERDAEKRQLQMQQRGAGSMFSNAGGGSNMSTTSDAATDHHQHLNNSDVGSTNLGGGGACGGAGGGAGGCWNAPPTVSIPVRRTSDRLRSRIEEAKRTSFCAPAPVSGGIGGSGGKRQATVAPHVQKWSSIAIDALQSILDLEKSMAAQQHQMEKKLQQSQQRGASSSAVAAAAAAAATTNLNSVDSRDIEEGLRHAAEPVGYLQEVSEQLRTHVEEFRDALLAANPEGPAGDTTGDESDANAQQSQQQRDLNARVPIALLMAVHNVASEFCDAIDDSATSLQKVQFDIDKAMSFIAQAAGPPSAEGVAAEGAAVA